jgi:hypothetical protein
MIQTKFGFHWSSTFRGEDFWKSLRRTTDERRTDDDGRQVMRIAHMTLWVRWAKNASYILITSSNAKIILLHKQNQWKIQLVHKKKTKFTMILSRVMVFKLAVFVTFDRTYHNSKIYVLIFNYIVYHTKQTWH